jgi:hypothetical protein
MGQSSRRSVLHVSQPTEGDLGRYVADLAVDQVARGWVREILVLTSA